MVNSQMMYVCMFHIYYFINIYWYSCIFECAHIRLPNFFVFIACDTKENNRNSRNLII